MAKRKDKLAEILKTYSEEEIRAICAESSSRSDFMNQLGLSDKHFKENEPIIESLIERFSLKIEHFIVRKELTYTRTEVETAYNTSSNIAEIAEKLGLNYYKSKSSQRRAVLRILEKYDFSIEALKNTSVTNQISSLDEETVQNNARIATSYNHLASLCGFHYSYNKLCEIGRMIAEYYDIDQETLRRNKMTTKEITSIASWLYHHNRILCSKCGMPLEEEAFILSPMVPMKDNELASNILCPNCHAKMKRESNSNIIETLVPISQDNCCEHGVYLIRHRNTGMLYVGETIVDFESRLNQHIAAARQTNVSKQAIERYMEEEGIDKFDFYILEILKIKDKPLSLKRENYWMSILGTNNKLIGYNQYLSPIKSHISEDVILAIIDDIKTLPIPIEDIAQKHGVSASNVDRIKNGKAHYLETEQYPILSAYDQMKINNIRRCLSLLANTSDSISKIAQNLRMSPGTVVKYNKGIIPPKLSQYKDAFDDFSFPIRMEKKITKPGQSKIIEKMKASDDKKATLEDQEIIEEIFQSVLQYGYSETAKQLDVIEQVLRKTLRKYGYPTNMKGLFIWLDKHPEQISDYRVPSENELIKAINLYGVTKASQSFQVGDALFKTWCEYRSVIYKPKRAVCIYIQELNKQFDTCSNAVRYLWEQGYELDTDMKRATATILRAIKRNNGHLLGLTFQRIETPIAYKAGEENNPNLNKTQ